MRFALPERLSLQKIIQLVLGLLLAVIVLVSSMKTINTGNFSGSQWRNLVVSGIALGSMYALIAMGYTLVYGILFIINFAHGEVFMAGGYTAFFVARAFSDSGFLADNPIISLIVVFAVGMLVSMMIAITLERVAYRRLRGAPRLVPLITAVGASLFLQNTFRGLYGAQVRAYPEVEVLSGTVSIFGMPVGKLSLLTILLAAALMFTLFTFITKTKTGRAMRAVGEDKEIASLMGIDVDRTIVRTFAIGGLLAGAAGVLWGLIFQVGFFMGFFPGIKAFTAAVLGGIGNVVGAGLGGLTLGVLESVAPNLLLTGWDVPSPNQLTDVIAFTVLVFVLIFKPGGILGSDEAEKV
ncbi:MAG TPA: branched-chain amino acid ABC transporter permease [Actinomycetota bacterium]|nr:branched-chain amino acid ABC transporter permease [Actinomycetota bacterium]